MAGESSIYQQSDIYTGWRDYAGAVVDVGIRASPIAGPMFGPIVTEAQRVGYYPSGKDIVSGVAVVANSPRALGAGLGFMAFVFFVLVALFVFYAIKYRLWRYLL